MNPGDKRDDDGGGPARLLIVVTGSPSAADAPTHLYVLRQLYPDLSIRVVVTRSALRFVTPSALAHRTGHPVKLDEWSDADEALHVELEDWTDSFAVFPATLDFLSRVAGGRGDSPSVLAIQCTAKPVVFVPALPPGGIQSRAYKSHWQEISAAGNMAIVPPRTAVSVTSGDIYQGAPGEISDVVKLTEALRHEQGRVREAQSW
ncbi:flavoprotein [Paenarthrobacter sp.]|uniref:flavoprotein n=1 Tax=Paenarthrobacter sp. TaxID=1931993 RepID=UPI0028126667|nr:flavoprotein [Paenarthrobacter sp.]